ncbi:MAG: hypothetical protein IJ087_22290 [Eggerthellaceae bacterium]|nr:hypothetical protein [Eggerthellaceae bacterium]
MRRIIAYVVSTVLIVGLLPASAFAEVEMSPVGGGLFARAQGDEPCGDTSARSIPLGQSGFAAGVSSQTDIDPQANPATGYTFDSTGVQTGVEGVSVNAENLGIGGGGALFASAISPHDPNTYESLRHFYYNTSGWDATSSIRAVAVDPAEPTHLYVLSRSYLEVYGWNAGLGSTMPMSTLPATMPQPGSWSSRCMRITSTRSSPETTSCGRSSTTATTRPLVSPYTRHRNLHEAPDPTHPIACSRFTSAKAAVKAARPQMTRYLANQPS